MVGVGPARSPLGRDDLGDRPTRDVQVVGGGEENAVDCLVVVVTHNSEHHIGPFLESIPAAAGTLTWHVVVVDNASADATANVVAGRPSVTWVPTGTNAGYAAGINVGRRLARPARALLVANPDVRLGPGCIERLSRAVTAEGHGAAVPRLTDATGVTVPSLRREPTVGRQLGEALLGDHLPGRSPRLAEIVRGAANYQFGHVVEWATGAVVMVSAACNYAVGDWDESYFLFSEEVDFFARVRAAGMSVAYVPEAVAAHEEGGSRRSAPLIGLLVLNRLRYYRRRHGRTASAAYAVALLLQLGLRSGDQEHRRALRSFVPALVPVLAGARRPPADCGKAHAG